MKHFLTISDLNSTDIESLLERAFYFKQKKVVPSFNEFSVANLFYENSTRTRVSFELAASHLGMKPINLDLQSSSEAKGELIIDTLSTLSAMGIQLFVIRHRENGLQEKMAHHFKNALSIINAGDGQHAHPSQAMLDLMTIVEKKPNLSVLKIAIVGDILHSRVANSLQALFKKIGIAELRLIAPPLWQPKERIYGELSHSLAEGLDDADVIITLRVQKERLLSEEHLDLEHYRRNFALTNESLSLAKKDAIVLHPGPINRGVEIDSDVADGEKSLILEQVTNGVFMRMAILEACADYRKK
ncbi:MAG: aspartate carbamoyltransferase catalytic subunit [Proteobacteria bacterium]|nr:aspartate carbamoyltransferase catalytic subunit [Pseudomonadota bacterium]